MKKKPHRWLLLHAYQRMNAIWMFKKGKFCLVIKDKSFPLGNRLPLFLTKYLEIKCVKLSLFN